LLRAGRRGAWKMRTLFPDDVLRGPHKGGDGVDCGHRGHALCIRLLALGKAGPHLVLPLGSRLAGLLPEVLRPHDHALAIGTDHQQGARLLSWIYSPGLVKPVKVPGRAQDQLLELALGYMGARGLLHALQGLVKGNRSRGITA
jgi:hypothetical protein